MSVLGGGLISGGGGGGGASSFSQLGGDPRDNAALDAELDAIVAGAGGVLNQADIVGLTGGGATSLDGIATTSVSVGTTVYVEIPGSGGQIWKLIAGTDVENAANGIVRPDDYNGVTNAKVWRRGL